MRCASANVSVTSAFSARTALTTISSGDFSFACHAPSDRNSGRSEHRLEHGAQVAVGLGEGRRHPIDQRLRRIVGDEALRELLGNELRRRWMMRQDVDHLQAVLLAAHRGNRVTEDDLFLPVVHSPD